MPVVTASYALKATVVENLDAADGANSPQITHDKFSSSGTLTPTSSVPATKVSADRVALVAGAKTIDLTALVGTNGAAVNGTGLKVQLFKFANRGAAFMTVSQGAANPYQFGGANWSRRVQPNQEILFYGHDLDPDIAAGAKNIDVAGTGTDEFELTVVMG